MLVILRLQVFLNFGRKIFLGFPRGKFKDLQIVLRPFEKDGLPSFLNHWQHFNILSY